MQSLRYGLSVAALVALAACGGGSSASSAASSAMQGAGNSMNSMAQQAPIPPEVRCGAVKPVWVNVRTGVYHEPGDPYYGRTKAGQYMCPSAAAKQGYHAAGGMMAPHHH
ncbi:MAG: hypothetical protein ACLQPV_07315 [Vulcanimicrobiaceae bacterium]